METFLSLFLPPTRRRWGDVPTRLFQTRNSYPHVLPLLGPLFGTQFVVVGRDHRNDTNTDPRRVPSYRSHTRVTTPTTGYHEGHRTKNFILDLPRGVLVVSLNHTLTLLCITQYLIYLYVCTV